MSELRLAIEAYRAGTLPDQPDAQIEEDFAELQRAAELIEVERMRRLVEIERRRLFERDGHLSAIAWLGARHRVGWGAARDSVRMSRALCSMTRTRKALESGEVSLAAARVLVNAHEADPAAFTSPRRSSSTRRGTIRSPDFSAWSACGEWRWSTTANRSTTRPGGVDPCTRP